MKSLALLVFVLLVAASCSDGDEVLGTSATVEPTRTSVPTPVADPGQAITVEISELLDSPTEREATVRGFVVWDDASARLCEVLAESFPPQCGGLSLRITNPEDLDVVFESEGDVRWTQGFVTLHGFFDGDQFVVDAEPADGDDNGSSSDVDGDPSVQDKALAEAFLGFVADPSVDRLGQLRLAESVSLGLGDELAKTVPATELVDPANWTIVRDEFRAWSGPFSALWLAEAPVIITVGPHLRCVADPVPAPPGFADHRRVSLQPEDATSCLEWWTVDFFLDPSLGQVEAVTLDLYAP